jgi:DNA-binding NarL/FixJ family response regulator
MIAPHLTPRQKQVLVFLKEGLGDKEISQRLNISTRTISNHVAALRKKFHVASRKQFRDKICV